MGVLNKSNQARNELVSSALNLVRLAHRDSSWRYSIIGNWLKFQIAKSEDEINFLKDIKTNSRIQNIRQTIADVIGLAEKVVKGCSFLLNAKRFQFDIERETVYVMDHLSLDYADKFCLLNQSFNLKYLVWHTIINTKLTCADVLSMYKSLPYCNNLLPY